MERILLLPASRKGTALRTILVIAALCLCAAPAAAQEPAKTETPAQPAATQKPAAEQVGMGANAEQELGQLADQYIAALKGKDAAALERLWADDLTFINPGGVVQTKAQRLADIQSGATKFDTLEASDRTVRVYGDAAVMTSLTTIKGQYGGREASGQYRVTQVLVRRGGAWQLVAIQMTPAATMTPIEKKP